MAQLPRVLTLGSLDVTSGRIVVFDPLIDLDAAAFTRLVPVSQHPIMLSIAVDEYGDEYVAAAMLCVSTRPVAKWEIAFTTEFDEATLEDGESTGYPVDSGLGSFMDADAQALQKTLANPEEYDERFFAEELEANDDNWAVAQPDPSLRPNVAVFSTGGGDGEFVSAFALDEDGGVVALVTDFGYIDYEAE